MKNIYSNFGLLFKNTKWANFSNLNLNLNLKLIFKWVLIFISLILCIFFLKWISSLILQFFWITWDTFNYCFSFCIWCFIALYAQIWQFCYSFFLINKFHSFFFTKAKTSRKLNYFKDNLFLSKIDFSWQTYLWMRLATYYPNFNTNQFFHLKQYRHPINNIFFQNLYQSLYFLNLLSPVYSFQYFQLQFFFLQKNINFNYNHFNLSLVLNNFNYLKLFYFFIWKQDNTNKKKLINRQNYFFHKKNFWNISNFFLEITRFPLINNFKNNQFYINYLTFNINNSIQNKLFLTQALKSQINFAKWNRWLAKYSIFHKNMFKSVNKLNFFKNYLNNQETNIDLVKKNVWSSEILKKNPNINVLLLKQNFKLNYNLDRNNNFLSKNILAINFSLLNNFFINYNLNSFFFF